RKTGGPASSIRREAWPANRMQLEIEGAAVIEDLDLCNGHNARAHAGDRVFVRVPNGAPFYGDLVRLADSYGDDEIEAVSRQRAQDQLEITEVVQAYAGTGGRAACKVGGAGDSGGSRKVADGGRGAFRELRKQLRADLLKSLVVDHTGVR